MSLGSFLCGSPRACMCTNITVDISKELFFFFFFFFFYVEHLSLGLAFAKKLAVTVNSQCPGRVGHSSVDPSLRRNICLAKRERERERERGGGGGWDDLSSSVENHQSTNSLIQKADFLLSHRLRSACPPFRSRICTASMTHRWPVCSTWVDVLATCGWISRQPGQNKSPSVQRSVPV